MYDPYFSDRVNRRFPALDNTEKTFFYGNVIDQELCFKTGQEFCFVINKTTLETFLMANSRYTNLKIVRNQDCYDDFVLEHFRFADIADADAYIYRRKNEFANGNFGNLYHFRVRQLPEQCIKNPDAWFLPGTHIQRDLGGVTPGNHEGIYLGKGKVAHVNPENHMGASAFISGGGKKEARARIDELAQFVSFPNQPIRIVDHCIERRTPEKICKIAEQLADDRYSEGEYNLLTKNCQHFAFYCATGLQQMSDGRKLFQLVLIGGGVVLVIIGVVWYLCKRQKKKESENKKIQNEMVRDDCDLE